MGKYLVSIKSGHRNFKVPIPAYAGMTIAGMVEWGTESKIWDMGLRKVLVTFLLLLFAPTICWGYALHVGNVSIPMHSEKYTTPSFNIKTEFGDIYHIPMTPQNISGTLHFFDGATTYSACSGTKTHVGHYWFIGPCLVGVDDGVYLKIQNDATNGYKNYINTGVSWLDSDRVEFTVGYSHTEIPPSGYENNAMFFAAFTTGSNYISYSNDVFYTRNNTRPQIISISPNIQMTQFKQLPKETFDIEYTTIVDGDIRFGSWSDRQWSRTMKWYGVNIYDRNTLLRQFVPVPSGMQIGNYITPSNGMWDVVEQKFYGNSGTGDFIYGVDQ